MKIIRIEEIPDLIKEIGWKREYLNRAIAAKARKRTERTIAAAEREIECFKAYINDLEHKLAMYEAENAEAVEMANAGGKVILAYHWNDDYGMKDSAVRRKSYPTIEDAEKKAEKLVKGNGGYVSVWIEIRGEDE